MSRFAVLALSVAACSRSQGMSDQDLPGLVTEVRRPEPAVDVEHAASDAAELGRAMARPYRVLLAAIGPHSASVSSTITVDEGQAQVSDLSDHAQIDNGDAGAFHAVYTNSADYGRETTFAGGRLYLRPRYQRWHARAPEAPDEPAALRDHYFEAVAATWDLLAPGAEIVDRGPIEVGGRRGRKIGIGRAAEPQRPPAEPIAQRAWREGRSIEAVTGEIVLDVERGVPLAVKLAGTVGFTRDGRRFTMRVSVDSSVSGIGTTATIAPPPEADVVATPERMREVDDRDYLLQGIAPPLRRNSDGTAIPPAPHLQGDPARAGSGSAGSGSAGSGSAGSAAPPADEPSKRRTKPARDSGAKP